jgi:hypothetical protein
MKFSFKLNNLLALISLVTIVTISLGISTFAQSVGANQLPDGKTFALKSNVGSYIDRLGDNINSASANAHTWTQRSITTDLVVKQRGRNNSAEIGLAANRNSCLALETGLDVNAIKIGTKVIFTNNCSNATNWILQDGMLQASISNGIWCADIPWGEKGNYKPITMNKCSSGMYIKFSVETDTTTPVINQSTGVNQLPDGVTFALKSNVGSYIDRFGDNIYTAVTNAHTWTQRSKTTDLVVKQRGRNNSAEIGLSANRNSCMALETGLDANAIKLGTKVIFTSNCGIATNWILKDGMLQASISDGIWCADIPWGEKGNYKQITMNKCSSGMYIKFSVETDNGSITNSFVNNFAQKWIGRSVPSGVDLKSFPGQCVSLVTMYQRELGKIPGYFPGDYPVPAFRAFLEGDRRMAPGASSLRDFNAVKSGDILIIGTSINQGFSHTAIALGSPVNGAISILESNANNSAPNTVVTYGTLYSNKFIGALRY